MEEQEGRWQSENLQFMIVLSPRFLISLFLPLSLTPPPPHPPLSLPLSPLSSSLPGIPTLILLDAEGHMITRQGRVEVLNDPECRLFPWHPRPVLELSESNAVQLHEGPCLVLFVGE